MNKLLPSLLLCLSLLPGQQVWVGPMTVDLLHTNDGINRDYLLGITNRSNWSGISTSAPVVSIWLGAIGAALFREQYGPLPFSADTALLKPMAAALSDKQIEVGSPSIVPGLYPGSCTVTTSAVEGMGPITAKLWILPSLRRWVAAGGHINKFTIDNGIGHAIEALAAGPFGDQPGGGCPGTTWTTRQLAHEQALSMAVIRAEFPQIEWGVTDGLNAYAVTGLDGAQYPGDPGRPSLLELLTDQVEEARAAGVTLSYFFLDSAQQTTQWGHTYAAQSGGAYWDYGKGLAAEKLCRSLGLKVGVYVTEPPNRGVSSYNAEFADFLSIESAYVRNYMTLDASVGGVPDYLSFVYWYGDMPNFVGSETTYGSEWYLDNELIKVFHTLTTASATPPPVTGTTATAPPTASMDSRLIVGSGPVRLTMSFTDISGWQSLGVVNALFNTGLTAAHGCYLAYSQPLKVLYLVGDDGLSLKEVNGSQSNSQCYVSDVLASGAGNTLSLTLTVAASGTFTGTHSVWLSAREAGEVNNSGWISSGSWIVQ